MEEKNEVEVYILSDENGDEHEFQLLDTYEKDGQKYYAMIPAEENDREEEYCEYVILKEVLEDGEKTLVSVEDDDEFSEIADLFDERLGGEIDYDQQ